jgi:hypothetical protein
MMHFIHEKMPADFTTVAFSDSYSGMAISLETAKGDSDFSVHDKKLGRFWNLPSFI